MLVCQRVDEIWSNRCLVTLVSNILISIGMSWMCCTPRSWWGNVVGIVSVLGTLLRRGCLQLTNQEGQGPTRSVGSCLDKGSLGIMARFEASSTRSSWMDHPTLPWGVWERSSGNFHRRNTRRTESKRSLRISANEFHQKKSIRKMLWKSPRPGWSFRIIDNGLIYLFSDLLSIDTVYVYIHICLHIYIYMRWLVVWNISHFSRPQLLELREPPEVQIFLEFSFELCWE